MGISASRVSETVGLIGLMKVNVQASSLLIDLWDGIPKGLYAGKVDMNSYYLQSLMQRHT